MNNGVGNRLSCKPFSTLQLGMGEDLFGPPLSTFKILQVWGLAKKRCRVLNREGKGWKWWSISLENQITTKDKYASSDRDNTFSSAYLPSMRVEICSSTPPSIYFMDLKNDYKWKPQSLLTALQAGGVKRTQLNHPNLT